MDWLRLPVVNREGTTDYPLSWGITRRAITLVFSHNNATWDSEDEEIPIWPIQGRMSRIGLRSPYRAEHFFSS